MITLIATLIALAGLIIFILLAFSVGIIAAFLSKDKKE